MLCMTCCCCSTGDLSTTRVLLNEDNVSDTTDTGLSLLHISCISGGTFTPTVGVGIAQWLECQTCDWKVVGSNPCRSGSRIFFSRVDFLCWLLFRYPFHPRVTTVAHKRSRSFCQKHRWQVTAKHTYICGFAWSDMVHGCMVFTELVSRWLQFHVAPAMPAL